MFVVTGSPRSGTGYASLLFKVLTIPCTHEAVYKPRAALDDVCKWFDETHIKGDSSFLAWAFFGVNPRPVTVLHQLRDPWKVIDSLAYRNDLLPVRAPADPGKDSFRRAIRAYAPSVFEHRCDVCRAAEMWVVWNELIEDAAHTHDLEIYRYRLEDVSVPLIATLLDKLDVYREEEEIQNAISSVPRNVNAGKQLNFGLKITNPDILAAIQKAKPGIDPIIRTAIKTDTPRTPAQLAEKLPADLLGRVNELAERYGYPQTQLSNQKESS